MTTTSYPLRMPEQILDLASLRSKEESVDKSTALKQFLYHGAEEYVLELISKERISIGKGAEMLNKTIYEMHDLALKHGVKLGPSMK